MFKKTIIKSLFWETEVAFSMSLKMTTSFKKLFMRKSEESALKDIVIKIHIYAFIFIQIPQCWRDNTINRKKPWRQQLQIRNKGQCKNNVRKGLWDHMPIIWIIFPVTGEQFTPQILTEHLHEENSLFRYYGSQKIKDSDIMQ